MAHKKGGGSTRNGRDSIGKRLGVGRDYTLFSKIDGYVWFERKDKYRRKVSVYTERPEF